MKTFVKILLAGIGLGVAGFLVKREYDKSKKQVEKEEQQLKEELEEVSISPEIYEKEIVQEEDEDNLAKQVYLSLRFDPKIDIDDINVSKFILEDDSETVIHLRNGSDVRGNTTFDFLFEIPGTEGDFARPNIPDYIRYFAGEVKNTLAKMTGFDVRTNLEGYYMVTYQEGSDREDTKCISVRIPKEDHEDWADEKNDGLANYVNNLEENPEKLKNIKIEDSRLIGKSYKIVDTVLLFKLSLPRKSSTRLEGLTVKSVRDILKYMTNNERLYVSRKGSNKTIAYPHIMVNAVDDFGVWSVSHYYEYRSGVGVVTDWYTY